ncbi:unnamed protein product [Rhizophagus irregularis]|nr:unnamed protein product [Rhizophagus irregularis]
MIRIPLENFNKYLGGSLPIDIDQDKSDSGSTTKESNVQFYAIDGLKETVKNPNQLMPLIGVLNSINLMDRITILCMTVNIARIVLTISDDIPDVIIPLGKKQKLGHSYITFFANSVIKLVPEVDLPYAQHLQSRVRFLTSMYKHAKGYPGLVQIKEDPLFIQDERMYKVKMTTRGIPCKLNNENDVREMTKCVLTGLARLHAGRYVHRDIRIPNIVFVSEHHDNFRYVLIDFEHRGMNKQKPSENLNGWECKYAYEIWPLCILIRNVPAGKDARKV